MSETEPAPMKTICKLIVKRERCKLAEPVATYGRVATSRDVAAIARVLLESESVEVFCVFFVDARNNVLGYSEIARGGLASCAIEPPVVYRAALLSNACAVVFAHNHPSGDPHPSADDCHITQKLVAGLRILDIQTLDHVIIGDDKHYSFCDAGLIKE